MYKHAWGSHGKIEAQVYGKCTVVHFYHNKSGQIKDNRNRYGTRRQAEKDFNKLKSTYEKKGDKNRLLLISCVVGGEHTILEYWGDKSLAKIFHDQEEVARIKKSKKKKRPSKKRAVKDYSEKELREWEERRKLMDERLRQGVLDKQRKSIERSKKRESNPKPSWAKSAAIHGLPHTAAWYVQSRIVGEHEILKREDGLILDITEDYPTKGKDLWVLLSSKGGSSIGKTTRSRSLSYSTTNARRQRAAAWADRQAERLGTKSNPKKKVAKRSGNPSGIRPDWTKAEVKRKVKEYGLTAIWKPDRMKWRVAPSGRGNEESAHYASSGRGAVSAAKEMATRLRAGKKATKRKVMVKKATKKNPGKAVRRNPQPRDLLGWEDHAPSDWTPYYKKKIGGRVWNADMDSGCDPDETDNEFAPYFAIASDGQGNRTWFGYRTGDCDYGRLLRGLEKQIRKLMGMDRGRARTMSAWREWTDHDRRRQTAKLGTSTKKRANPKATKKKVAKKKVAKKKVARKKTPEWQLLINRCRKLWDHYCERPSKKRLKPVLEHLEKMKASTSKKVADERKSCLRIANKEARSLKMK